MSTDTPAQPKIERDEQMNRDYIPQPAQEPAAPFLFIAMDDDKRAHLTWCADEAAVHEAVKRAMFFTHDNEPLDADHVAQLTGSAEELLGSGALTFEGDAPLYLFRVGSAIEGCAAPTQAAPVAELVEALSEAESELVGAGHDGSQDDAACRALKLIRAALSRYQEAK